MSLDILYVAWNRLEFTKFSFEMLLENTDWSLVSKLVIHDDSSEDGTRQWLKEACKQSPVEVVFRLQQLRSPPAVMNRYVADSEAEWFAKIDNDIVVPPSWLPAMVEAISGDIHVDAIGMEAGRGFPTTPEWDGVYRFEDGSHMGGVGLIRVEALAARPRMSEAGLNGWTKFQHEYGVVVGRGPVMCGWINPDLPVVSLDRVPFEPWLTLTDIYIEREWGREWGKYHERADYWDWWPK